MTQNSVSVSVTSKPSCPSPNAFLFSFRRRETLVGECGYNLLLLLLLGVAAATLGGLGLLPSDTAGAATTEGRGQREIDVLLGVETDDERGHVDDLLAYTDVALADEDTGVVDGLGETELVDTSLQATLKEILDLEGEHVIELHAGLVEHTDTHETANQGVAFKETLGVLLIEGEQLTAEFCMCIPGSTTNLGQGELDTPDLTLVLQTILADELQLGVAV
ncbi:hypothetical protein FJTKL_04529 [Diaporthe vaccinii]|uniref:Uncharacterized protein n=1 Tax=Diaporthe vaccinii TaxID=105482 RepID=A0ABR4DSV3_9PEZI